MPNRLAHETSPYLRQHADNPVDWYPWGEEAFAEARRRDRPILLSVGYSSCHWCHVMAHESFEDDATAAVMNELYVNVKVDREERPDVDAIYMSAVQAMTGRGGWPMTVFLTPDGTPFYGGTYFPPEDRPGMPSFERVLRALDDVWTSQREQVLEQGAQLREHIERDARPLAGADDLPEGFQPEVVARLEQQFDTRHGGFGRAPKFPQAMTIDLLLREFVRSGDERALRMAVTTLDHMAAGGMHDHLGGGFARYSTDDRWLVPHFEKMLYDQALLLGAYLRAFLITGDERHRVVAEGIVGYVLRDLATSGPGWASAEDADSEGVEGRFYLWNPEEVRDACPDPEVAEAVIEWFSVTPGGNFTDPHTGHVGTILAAPAPGAPMPAAVRAACPQLLAHRSRRVRPSLDDKVLLAWNAWFVRSLAEAATALGRPDWMEAARANARFLLAELRDDHGRLLRSWQAGRAHIPAYAEDHAALLGALVTLAEVDEVTWLDAAREVADALLRLFARPGGGFFTTGEDQERLIARTLDLQDNATPSANSLAGEALLRLADLTGQSAYREAAVDALRLVGSTAIQYPTAFAFALGAMERATTPTLEVALVTPDPAMRAEVFGRVLPASVVVCGSDGASASRTPLLEGRTDLGDGIAYVCEAGVCRLPASDPIALRAEINAVLERRRG
ncbi:MAG: thioredoxin domain-containing protein [Actinomycetes bacterium]